MTEYIVPSLLTLLAVVVGFFLKGLSVDANIKLPKKKTKPKAVTVTDRKGTPIKVSDPLINPLEKAFDDHEKKI